MTRKPDLDALAAHSRGRGLPPVDAWNPPLSGDMDLRIARDGRWWHEGVPIARPELVRLFASILRRDEDGHYYLLSPVEKWRIRVEDAPFLAVGLEAVGQGQERRLRFITNLEEVIEAGPEHPLRVDIHPDRNEPAPYVHVRGRLWAKLTRSTFLELAELGEEREQDGETLYGVWSGGVFFTLGRLEE
ncbi:MAG TPA: DUF1285 domain-containing protein [Candidatus Competibacteraceae bacterium]|nr:DUF1285 domain-containing protein [Candidatus Competibacteraceae bacterium]